MATGVSYNHWLLRSVQMATTVWIDISEWKFNRHSDSVQNPSAQWHTNNARWIHLVPGDFHIWPPGGNTMRRVNG